MAPGQHASTASVASRASALVRRAGAVTAYGARVFWRWSGGRPFWGGLLLVLSGAELFLSSNMDLKGVQIHLGFSGFLSYLVPAILVLCGVFTWFTPAQRGFYAIIGTLTAVYSLIGLNFGGWFLGMLIGIAGGALSFAWSPAPAPAPATTSTSTSGASDAEDDTTALVRPRAPEPASSPRRRGDRPFRALALLTVPLVLVATIGLHAGRSAASVPIGAPAIAVTPCPATPTPTASASRNLQDYWNEFLEWLNENWQTFTGDLTAFWNWLTGKESTATPAPTASCGASTGSGGTSTAVPTAPSDLPPGTTLVSAHPALLTSTKQTLKDFRYEGVVSLPTATGTIRVLKFSLSSATNADFKLLVDGPRPWVTNANPLVVSGDVLLYTSRFSGKLLGIPLTFTPDSPPPLALPLPNGQYLSVTLPEIVFTDVQLNLVLITCQHLTATGMSQSFA